MIRTIFGTLVVFALFSTTRHVLAQKSEYIVKASFEKGSLEKGTGVPDGWEQAAPVRGVKYVYESKFASHGKRCLGMRKSAQRYFPIAAWNHIVSHRSDKSSLQVSAKVKAAKATKAVIDLRFFDGSGDTIGHEWAVYIGQKNDSDPVATHGWKKYTGTVDIPDETKELGVSLQIYGPGSVWFDELLVRYAGPAAASSTADNAKSRTIATRPLVTTTEGGGRAEYFLLPPADDSAQPNRGYPLVLILPGGDGSSEFHPFVKAIHELALGGEFIVAQPVAPPQIVWPTQDSRKNWPSTEESIDGIIEDVAKKHKVDRDQIFALAWSSGGPAIYATILQQDSPLAGAMIAMSVFKPASLPSLDHASGKRIYLLHSPEDSVCPYRMADNAENQLTQAGAEVTLVDYSGGHGWHGPVHDNIRAGFEWLRR